MSDSGPREFVLAGTVMKRLASGEQTQGSLCLLENRTDGHSKTPIHVHADDDETVYVLEGQLIAIVDGEVRTISAGESISLKRGVPHQLMSSQPSRYILVCTPSLFEQFVSEAGRELRAGDVAGPPSPADIERLKAAAPRFGITLLPDWPAKEPASS